MIENGGYFIQAVSDAFTIGAGTGPSVSITSQTAGTITANYTGSDGSNGFVAVYDVGGVAGQGGGTGYYAQQIQIVPVVPDGTVSLDISSLASGSYELRLIENGGYFIQAVSDAFTIGAGTGPSVSITSQTAGTITANYTGSDGSNGFVAVYDVGGVAGQGGGTGYYAQQIQIVPVVPDGTVSLDISSLASGSYELRLIENGGYFIQAVSDAFQQP